MAPPAGTIRPGRYLAFFLMIVVVLYGLVFFTGDREPSPRLGIDLKGGTSVTLTARTPDGSEPTRESLNQARSIIGERVNGLGVNGAEVVLDGTQIVITVPGDEGEQAKTLGQTAKLGFRKVVAGPFDPAALANAGQGGQQGDGTAEPGKGSKDDDAKDDGKGDDNTGGGSAVAGAAQDDQDAEDKATDETKDDASQVDPGLPEETQKEITEARKLRQSKDLIAEGPQAQAALEKAIKSLDCGKGKQDPLRGNDDPTLPLVACDQDRASAGTRSAYLLGPVILDGQMIKDSTSSVNQDGIGHQVNIEFTNAGSSKWAKITSEMAQESAQRPQNDPARVSFVMDTEVVSAPSVTQAIAGNTRITGDFT
ncbi:MAG: protein translocase subunit SecD, partial [Actinophytocola sp.]|nr:protein translocase subunit SecD [Actinophytocola sp.]